MFNWIGNKELVKGLSPMTLIAQDDPLPRETLYRMNGNIKETTLVWRKEGFRASRSQLGSIVLKPNALELHTDSQELLKEGIISLKKCLGNVLKFDKTECADTVVDNS